MGGLARLCKLYGAIEVRGVRHVWDYAADCAVPESEMPPGSERHAASERAKWREVEAWEDAARARPDPEEAFRELARAANGRWDGVDAESYVADLRKDG